MIKTKRLNALIVLCFAAVFLLNGCSTKTTGTVSDDSSVTGVSEGLAHDCPPPKLRVGVVDFKNNTPAKAKRLGEAATDILGTILHKTGCFIVVPQQDMKSILEQQALGASGAVDPSTAAQMGKILGLNAIVTGSITAYSESEEGLDMGVYKSKKQIAKVTVDYRIVDTTTGVQMMADSGMGEYKKKTGGALGMGSKSTYDTSLRDGALRDALTKAMVNMLDSLKKTEWSGRIAQVKGSTVYINAGQETGLNIGDILVVEELGEEIIDPQTRVSLGRAPGSRKGELMITAHFGTNGSVAAVRSGAGFKINDIVKIKK